MPIQKADFFRADPPVEIHEKIGRAEIPVVFHDFIFQDKMIAEGIPCQFIDHTMILMKVSPAMSENQVGRKSAFHLLEILFDLRPAIREEAVLTI
jgi:hypothetical protein